MRYEISAQYVSWGEFGTDEICWRKHILKFKWGSCAYLTCFYVSDIYMSLLSGALPGDV